MILVVGAVIALAVSESLRSKVLDTLFGAEEEFQYTPPVGTPAPPPASTGHRGLAHTALSAGPA